MLIESDPGAGPGDRDRPDRSTMHPLAIIALVALTLFATALGVIALLACCT